VFFKPEASRLRVLVRVPLRLCAISTFQRLAVVPGFSRTDSLLPDASRLWISDSLDVFEDETRLAKTGGRETRISLESDKSFCDLRAGARARHRPRLAAKQTWCEPDMLDVFLNIRHFRALGVSIQPAWGGSAFGW